MLLRFNIRSRQMRHFRLAAALFVLVVWLVGWTVASAQSWPGLQGVVADNTGKLDADKVNSATEGLLSLGVKPLAVLFQSAPGYSSSEALARAAAAQYKLASGNTYDPDLLAIVVVLDTKQSTILYGDRLKSAMEQQRGNGKVADDIRTNYLNPSLAGGDFTTAFADSFTQAAKEIELYQNPLPTSAPAPPIINTTKVDTQGLGNALLIGLLVLIVLGVLVIGGPIFWRQRRRAQEAAARSRALRGQLAQARNVTSDMLSSLDFPEDPHQQIQYRFLALALEKERPQQLAQITSQYQATYERIADALAQYNTLNEGTYTTDEQVSAAITRYQGIQAAVQDANNFLQHLADMGKEVEAQTTAAPKEADAAKKP